MVAGQENQQMFSEIPKLHQRGRHLNFHAAFSIDFYLCIFHYVLLASRILHAYDLYDVQKTIKCTKEVPVGRGVERGEALVEFY